MRAGCAACRGCVIGTPAPEPAVSGRPLNLAAGICLGIPLAVLVAGGWLADTLGAGQAWWAILLFAGASATVSRAGSRLDAWLLKNST